MITNIIGFATVAITSLMALIKAMGTGKAIDDLSQKTDGKLTQLIEAKTANATLAENIRMTDLAKPVLPMGTTTTTTTFEPQVDPKPPA
jgi:CheY-specific phosphatase CheX